MATLDVVDLSAAHPLVAAAIVRYGLVVEVVACDPSLADTAAFCAAYGVSPGDSANTIVVIGKGPEPAPLAACLVLATSRLDVNGAVRQLFGTRKASFAPQDLACQATEMEYGGVTAIGLPATIPLWIDGEVIERREVIIGGGNRSTKLRLDPRELNKLPNVSVVPGLAKAAV